MNLIDRLIARAKTVQMAYGDNVFIISKETCGWTVEGQTFPDLEAAQEYVDSLLPENSLDCTVIIDDLGPCDMEALEALAENSERIRKEKERLNEEPTKDRKLI